VNSSGPQRQQEEPCRNSSRIPRNTRSQRRTIREHSRHSWNGCEQFRTTAAARGTLQEQFSNTAEHSLTEKNNQRTLWNGCEQFRTTAEARGTLQEQFSSTAEHSLTEKNNQRTLAEQLEWL